MRNKVTKYQTTNTSINVRSRNDPKRLTKRANIIQIFQNTSDISSMIVFEKKQRSFHMTLFTHKNCVLKTNATRSLSLQTVLEVRSSKMTQKTLESEKENGIKTYLETFLFK